MRIHTPADFGRALQRADVNNSFFICHDGTALCPFCAADNGSLITHAIRSQATDLLGRVWLVEQMDTNWNDSALYCGFCGSRIESVYREEEAAETRSGKRQ